MSGLQTAKFWLIGWTGLAKDALHVYVGLAIFLGAIALVRRWRLGDWRPVLVVLVAALIGEAWDLRDTIVFATPLRPWGNWHDVWNTCFWPAALTALARWTRILRR